MKENPLFSLSNAEKERLQALLDFKSYKYPKEATAPYDFLECKALYHASKSMKLGKTNLWVRKSKKGSKFYL